MTAAHLYICTAERQAALCHELQAAGASPQHAGSGWVLSQDTSERQPVRAFCAQVLPHAQAVTAPSVSAWAQAVTQPLMEQIHMAAGAPWRLHLFTLDAHGVFVQARRLALIEAQVVALLKKRQRRLLATRLPPHVAWEREETFVQVALQSPEAGFVAVSTPAVRRRFRHVLSRFAAGFVDVPEDKRPPARAYRKLVEAQAHLGRFIKPGHTCVDLGASPGSWTYVALDQGAAVTAIDRSPLAPSIMTHGALHFVQADAFKYAPAAPVTWLLCDVIAYPQRTLELLQRWLAAGWCRHFIVTLKFQGRIDYGALDACRDVMAPHCHNFALRALTHNKNEVTAYGTVRRAAGTSPIL